jgi:uncharacterized protein (DUF488 family)
MRVWTVGHSTHSIDAFVALLVAHDIAQVADIRTVPKSRRHPHFHIDALARSLPERGLAYVHLPRLGGWRRADEESPNRAWRNPCFVRTPTTRWVTNSPADSLSYAGSHMHGVRP